MFDCVATDSNLERNRDNHSTAASAYAFASSSIPHVLFMFVCSRFTFMLIHSSGQVPYFNAPIFLENKSQVGKVDEIFGKIKESVRNHSCPVVSACEHGDCAVVNAPTAPSSAMLHLFVLLVWTCHCPLPLSFHILRAKHANMHETHVCRCSL